MRKYVIQGIALEKETTEADPSRVFISMPIGARILDADLMEHNQIVCAVLIEQPQRPVAKHRITIIPINRPVTIDLGRTLGEKITHFVGPIGRDGNITTFFLFQDLPWPVTSLEGMKPAGEG